jgi:uncharacterized protein YlxP (DUF503 family)
LTVVISVLHFVLDLPDITSIKEKRQVVLSVKNRLQHRFKFSVAEVDLQDSLRYSQLAAVMVSNSRQYGETVMNKALAFVEKLVPGRIRDTGIFSEHY